MAETQIPQIFDRARLRRRLARLAAQENFYIDHLIEDAGERLSTITRDFAHALIIVPNADAVTEKIGAIGQIKNADIISLFSGTEAVETLGAPARDYDLILCLGCLQAINDVPGMLAQIKGHLKADGLFVGAMMGGQTLAELRQSFMQAEIALYEGASPRVAPFADVRDAGGLLQRAGFALPVSDADRLTVRYGSMIDLVNELRALGASNPLVAHSNKATSKALIAQAGHYYHENFSDDDGRIRATLETIWMSGWSPHESQQKPLKPGSAKMRLADALNTTETKL